MAASTKQEKSTRIRVIIDEQMDSVNEGVNTDVFVGVNGRGYLIKRGEEALVPLEVYSVLKNAVTTIELDNGKTKDVPRFSYRILGEE